MKIVKVVHCCNSEEIEIEKQLLALKDYDVESFMRPHTEELGDYLFTPEVDQLKLTGVSKLITKVLSSEMTISSKKNIFNACMIGLSNKMIKDINRKMESVEILPLDVARVKYPNTCNLSIGTYTLHPYDSKILSRLEYYHKKLSMEKDDELIVLLGKMGAKRLKIIERDTRERKEYADADISSTVVEAKVGSNINISGNYESDNELVVEFEGKAVEINADLLSNSLWYSSDSKLRAIFESRRFNPNKMEKYTLRNTYTETFDFDFTLASKYIFIDVDLKVEYNSLSKKERFFEIEFGGN